MRRGDEETRRKGETGKKQGQRGIESFINSYRVNPLAGVETNQLNALPLAGSFGWLPG